MRRRCKGAAKTLAVFFRPFAFFFVRGKKLDIEKMYRFSKREKNVFVDLRIDAYHEIYNEWEFAPDAWGDLDDELFEYLEECAFEIPEEYRLCVCFHLPAKIENQEKERTTAKGYRSYFNYRVRKLRVEIKNERKKIFFYLVTGSALLATAFFTGDFIVSTNIKRFLSEGFFVGAWVVLWELFTALFFTSTQLMDRYSVLERLLKAGVEFVYDA